MFERFCSALFVCLHFSESVFARGSLPGAVRVFISATYMVAGTILEN
jgi:hypothetical protein